MKEISQIAWHKSVLGCNKQNGCRFL